MSQTAAERRRTSARILPSSPRYREWLQFFGTDSVVLESPVPVVGRAPALPGMALFYKLDIDALPPERRERLIRQQARRFSLSTAEIERAFADPRHGVPILLDDDVVLSEDLDPKS